MDENNSLVCLGARLDRLEKAVYCRSTAESKIHCLDTLMDIHNKLQYTSSEKISPIFNKLADLEKFLNPVYKENLTMDLAIKANLLLLDEENLRKTVDALQTLRDLSQFLESEHIQGVPSLFPKLQNLLETQKTLQDKSVELSVETRQLIIDYDNIILSLSKHFVLWDSMLTKIEKAKLCK